MILQGFELERTDACGVEARKINSFPQVQTHPETSGFEDGEVLAVIGELHAYKSIPGTTLRRYVNRVQSSIDTDCRPAFLKGMIVGTAIWENLVVDRADLERRIDGEMKRRLRRIIEDLDRSDADPIRDPQVG